MSIFRKKSRIKVPDRIAAFAAVLLLVSALAGPQAFMPETGQGPQAGPESIAATTLETDEPEIAIVSAPPRKSRSFDISSLIFRF